jgi:acetylornithine deacetylase/succinyl-diaminopimelate desuccinylase-like protein
MKGLEEYEDIFNYIDLHFDEWLEKTREYLRIPSISLIDRDDKEGKEQMEKAANFVLKEFQDLGAEGCEIFRTTGWPVVYGKLMSENPNARRLLLYGMYDVMPVEGQNWTFPPFEARIVDAEEINAPAQLGKIICARGTMNQKVPHMGALLGVKAMKAVAGDVSVSLFLFCEGEEELNSPTIDEFVEAKKHELMTAEGEMVPGRTQDWKGMARIHLGQKGSIMLELHIEGGDWGGPAERSIFPSDDLWVDAPLWRLTWALSTLKDPNTGRVLIDGFYDDWAPPTPDQLEMIKKIKETWDEEWGGPVPRDGRRMLGVKKFLRGLPGRELIQDYIMKPTINIDGIQGGYVGPKVFTQMPRSGDVKIDIRIMPYQRPEDIVWKLKKHLHMHGFPEVEIHVQGINLWSKIDPECDIVKAAKTTYERFNVPYITNPSYWGEGPHEGHVRKPLGFSGKGLEFGLGIGGRSHSKDEFETVEGLRSCAKSFVVFFNEYAKLAGQHK